MSAVITGTTILASREVLGGFLLHRLGEAETVEDMRGAGLRGVSAQVIQPVIHVHQLLLGLWTQSY
jgi:hypothetical protein